MKKATLIQNLVIANLLATSSMAVFAGNEISEGPGVTFTLERTKISKDLIPDNQAAALQVVLNKKSRISHRLEAVGLLSSSLSSEEISTLYQFLRENSIPDEMLLSGIRMLKNEIMNMLRSQTEDPDGLAGLLTELYNDDKQDDVIRDYAIQHLGAWCQEISGRKDEEVLAAYKVLERAARMPDSIAGTALIALHRLSEVAPYIDCASVDALALDLVSSSKTHRAARVSAIQVCSERGIMAAIPVIQSIESNTNDHQLSLSASAALTSFREASSK